MHVSAVYLITNIDWDGVAWRASESASAPPSGKARKLASCRIQGCSRVCEALEVPTVEAGEEQMRFLLPFSTFPPNWKIYLCECGLLAGLT